MAFHHNNVAMLSYSMLIAPLDLNPVTEMDRRINEPCLKYRTYMVEVDVEYGAIMLPMMFSHDFGDQIQQYATLIDPKRNQFEVLVERNNQGIYLTKGWHAIRDFYKVQFGSWVTIVFMGNGRFNIRIKNRFGKRIRYPTFNPPMNFRVEHNDVPVTVDWFVPRPFMHDEMNFQFTYEKKLDVADVKSGFLELAEVGFAQMALDRETSIVDMVDENGNIWNYTLNFSMNLAPNFKIGGGWELMVKAKRFTEGARVVVGAPSVGMNLTLYFCMIRR